MSDRADSTTDLSALDLKRVFHPNTNLAALHRGSPLVLVRGRGVHVWDDHGKQYIEAMAGLWCATLGYGDDELARTAYDQIKKLAFSHLFTGKSHEPGILLADKLARMAPFAASRVFFGNSGSDANDTQITARRGPRRGSRGCRRFTSCSPHRCRRFCTRTRRTSIAAPSPARARTTTRRVSRPIWTR